MLQGRRKSPVETDQGGFVLPEPSSGFGATWAGGDSQDTWVWAGTDLAHTAFRIFYTSTSSFIRECSSGAVKRTFLFTFNLLLGSGLILALWRTVDSILFTIFTILQHSVLFWVEHPRLYLHATYSTPCFFPSTFATSVFFTFFHFEVEWPLPNALCIMDSIPLSSFPIPSRKNKYICSEHE